MSNQWQRQRHRAAASEPARWRAYSGGGGAPVRAAVARLFEERPEDLPVHHLRQLVRVGAHAAEVAGDALPEHLLLSEQMIRTWAEHDWE